MLLLSKNPPSRSSRPVPRARARARLEIPKSIPPPKMPQTAQKLSVIVVRLARLRQPGVPTNRRRPRICHALTDYPILLFNIPRIESAPNQVQPTNRSTDAEKNI